MPANICRGGDTLLAVYKVKIDHRHAAVRVAFLTGLQAGLAADAARGIDVKLHAKHYERSPGPGALSIRHADTLYSGILLRGSRVRCVNRLALRPPGRWY